MPVSLQVIYPVSDDSHFDYDYYMSTHMALVNQYMGPHLQSALVTKGLAGGPDRPSPVHAVASMVFADQGALDAALSVAGPVMADLPNFTNSKAQMVIGEVLSS